MIRAGVMGDPIAHSLSPKLHGHWLKRYAIAGEYGALHVTPDALEGELRALSSNGFAGVNLTLPHKEAALGLLDEVSEEATQIGAVNTVVVRRDGTLYGTNTDAYGFIENLRDGAGNLAPHLEHVFVLGAGGAACAVVYGLLKEGAKKITIANRTVERAEALAQRFGAICNVAAWDDIPAALANASLLVNTTSLGMTGKAPLEISLETLPSEALVTDIVYTPLITPLLQNARARGNPTQDGLGMLLHQARPGFEAWFGTAPIVDDALTEMMRSAL